MKAVLSLLFVLVPCLALAETKTPVIGKKVGNFTLRDYRGAERSLQEFADKKLVVVVFMGTECPVAKLYGPRLAKLAGEFEPRGVAFLGLNANQQDAVSAIGQYAKTSGITFPILKDVGNVVADQFGAERTPEAYVLDSERVIRYRGRIDDQYGVGYARPRAGRRDLALALEELLAGKAVGTPLTEAPGCYIGRIQQASKQGTVTYGKEIAPILQKYCVSCHTPGEIAPFSLTSYDEVAGWTDTIQEVVKAGRMPPWHADRKYGIFSNDCHLPDVEKQLLLSWIEQGAPKGDTSDLPKPAVHSDAWRIPKPDVVVSLPKPYKVPADGTVAYQFFAVDPGFTEDKWVKAAEVKPGCRAVVHHILVFVQEPNARQVQRGGGFIKNWLAASVPGAYPMIMPDGMAKLIPAGSRLLFQIHYTPNGSPQLDQSSIGLVFADPKSVHKIVSTDMAANNRFQIPPNDPNYLIESRRTLDQDMLLLTLMPHTHLRGKTFKYEAIYPDGKTEILLDVPRYDFNWQNTYALAEPKVLPKGTELHCIAHYDNSKSNFSNPNPDATVRWGEQTWQEMMIGYFDLAPVAQDLQKNPRPLMKLEHPKLPALDAELRDLAHKALESQAAWEAFAAAVHKAQPKVDRVCLTAIHGDHLRVERAAYPGAVERRVAETGFEQPGMVFALTGYALFGRATTNADLKKANGADMNLMSRALASSAHVPIIMDGLPATLNFWSKEGDAFSPEMQLYLRAVAKEVVLGKK